MVTGQAGLHVLNHAEQELKQEQERKLQHIVEQIVVLTQKLKTVTRKHVVHQFVLNMVDMEHVLNRVEQDQCQELYINIVIITDNYVIAGVKVQTVIHIHVVHQHIDLVDTGQDVQNHVIQELKNITIISTVITLENTVEHHIIHGNTVIHIHVVHQHMDQVDGGQDALLHVVEDGKITIQKDIVTILDNIAVQLTHMDKAVTLTHVVHMYITQRLEHIVHQQVSTLEYHGKI